MVWVMSFSKPNPTMPDSRVYLKFEDILQTFLAHHSVHACVHPSVQGTSCFSHKWLERPWA